MRRLFFGGESGKMETCFKGGDQGINAMEFIADFHIHSHFSVATSRDLKPEYLDYWARIKGITVVGSGDFTHPGWVKELKEKLEPAEEGLFRLKPEFKQDKAWQTPFLPPQEVRFILSAEISSIYKKRDKVRKVHNVIFAPDFQAVEKIQQKLSGIGANITSDGRPILGLDCRDLLEMCLDASERIIFVPAHIWTPWFSVLGDKSGFESIEECFDDLGAHIFALETGLSSDPPMNWMCSFLDRFTLTSNSDAHSPERLGRNANRFDTELCYAAITAALKSGDPAHCLGTIDLFPQEGKYHYDGHRKCGICWNPLETLENEGICPRCGKAVTVGVMNRVVRISDRQNLDERCNRLPFVHIIPLKEILAEIMDTSPTSRKVDEEYFSLIKRGNPELFLLLDKPIAEIEAQGHALLAEAVRRMRNRQVFVKEGFDGEYGQVKVFEKAEKSRFTTQKSLFAEPTKETAPPRERRPMINFDLEEYRRLQRTQAQREERETAAGEDLEAGVQAKSALLKGLNPEQQQAVLHLAGPALIVAGPGTGKTRVLAFRTAHLVQDQGIKPENILAVTFTNKAAAEMRARLKNLLKDEALCAKMTVTTFHGLGISILKGCLAGAEGIDRGAVQEKLGRDGNFSLIDEEDKKLILSQGVDCDRRQVGRYADAITHAKQDLKSAEEIEEQNLAEIFNCYEAMLREQNALDLDDLIALPVTLFKTFPQVRDFYRQKFQWIMVDEYQDINHAQYHMVGSLVSKEQANLFVIGDPDQAIYGFRGADVAFIRRFIDDFPGAPVYLLKKSYRCSDSILLASHHVMQKREAAAPLTGMGKGVKITIARNPTHKSEAEFTARTIEAMMGGLRFFSMDSQISAGEKSGEIDSLSDFAVLCRTRAQMEALEKAFNDHSIPYQAVGDQPFFKQEPIQSIIDMLKLARNPASQFLRNKLQQGRHLQPLDFSALNSLLKEKRVLRDFLAALVDHYFIKEKRENEPLIQGILDLAVDFDTDLEGFLQFAALGTGVDTYRANLERVALMTLHAAKGLEFKCVFIVGCEDGLLPYSLFESQRCDREEERRLLYVGMTRAKQFLFLCHADKRFIQGREYRLERSPFLDPIEKELIELSQQDQKKKGEKGEEFSQRTLFD